ncbi:putative MFS family arabinose efflux permease [Pseudonocardia hierapolitana]|uniref:Putative MFS family arabinose efflux permease n=1 Tax=Pseudonocardia hierapolitana TaxID=1128676 RepID=A0A561STP7_9PSEU|nr:MFS transporter [Pseudonocardia hierapolitana]TWF78236.1 putative MFS family arabinose efflux permease [Pseudonocardia hierapolitana]
MAPRRARIGVSIVFLVCGAAFATWAARVPAAQERLGLTEGELALGLFGLAAGSVLALVGAGALVTLIGSKRTSILGATVLCAGLPAVAAAPDLGLFVAALAVLGAGNSLLDVAMNAHAARVENAYGRPIFAGFHAFWNIGGLGGSGLAAGLAAADVPIGVHFPIAAAVLLGAALGATTAFLPGTDPGAGGPAFSLPGRALVPLGVIAFCGFLAEGTVNDWSAVLLTTASGASDSVASLGYFAFSITMIGVRLMADRFVVRAGAVRVMRVAAAVTVAGFAIVVLAPVPAVGIAGFAVVGLGAAAIVPVAWSVAAQKEPNAPGRAIAAVATCGYLGFLVGPVLVGVLASAIGLAGAVAVAGAAPLVVFLLAPSLRVAARLPR